MESSGRQLSKNTKYAIVHALLGKKVRYQPVSSALCSLNVNKVSRVFFMTFFWFVKIRQSTYLLASTKGPRIRSAA